MSKRCFNMDCWNALLATDDDLCIKCLSPTTWAESLDPPDVLLPDTATIYNDELSRCHTTDFYQSSSFEPSVFQIPTTSDRKNTLSVSIDYNITAFSYS